MKQVWKTPGFSLTGKIWNSYALAPVLLKKWLRAVVKLWGATPCIYIGPFHCSGQEDFQPGSSFSQRNCARTGEWLERGCTWFIAKSRWNTEARPGGCSVGNISKQARASQNAHSSSFLEVPIPFVKNALPFKHPPPTHIPHTYTRNGLSPFIQKALSSPSCRP